MKNTKKLKNKSGYAVFLNEDGSTTKLNWDELNSFVYRKKYYYKEIKEHKIDAETFKRCEALTEIVIQEGIESIERAAFCSCKNLKKAVLPSTLKRIEASAFLCSGIEKIYIPEGVEYCDHYAFFQCHQLKEIEAKKGLYINNWMENIVKRFEYSNQEYSNLKKSYTKKLGVRLNDLEKNNISGFYDTLLYFNQRFCSLDDQRVLKEKYQIFLEIIKFKNKKNQRYFNIFETTEFMYSCKNNWCVLDEVKKNIAYCEKNGIEPFLVRYDKPKCRYVSFLERQAPSFIEGNN